MTKTTLKKRTSLWLIALGMAFSIGGLYGVFVGAKKIFPFHQLSAIKDLITSSAAEFSDLGIESTPIITSHLLLEKLTYYPSEADNLNGFGGGLARVRDFVLGVDRLGTFFTYRSPGKIHTFDLGACRT